MGLDIALGVIILLGAIRGWFRGFVLQAIRLGGLVGCVYAAGPIRDQARPYVVPYLASIPPPCSTGCSGGRRRWSSYLAMVGLASLAVKLYRRRPYGEPEPNRADQFAGLLLAGGKAAVVAAFLVGALDKYALTWIKQVPWATDQVRSSTALTWNEQYRPSERIWSAAPVQHFVAHVRKMGVAGPSGTRPEAPSSRTRRSRPPAARPGSNCPSATRSTRRSPDFAREVRRGIPGGRPRPP